MASKSRIFNIDFFIFFLLLIIVVILQLILLALHLRYGFADVDWSFLLSFKELSNSYHNPISFFLGAWKQWGVYTYQVYYIGLIEKFFGTDYRNFQIVTHIFKVIATLSLYPLILQTTKSRLAAFLTTLIYAVSYSAVGVMYTVVTSGLFVAIPMMSLFLFWYSRLISKGKNNVQDIIIALVLFFLTLLLATERMYPLVPTLVVIELFWWFKNGFSKSVLKQILKRLGSFIAIFVLLFLYKPATFTSFFGNTVDSYSHFLAGNWQVLMTPVISLGSLFLPRDYWKYLGVPNIDSFSAYIGFFIQGPLIIFTIVTVFLSLFLSRHKRKFILFTMLLTNVFALLVYVLSSHQLGISDTVASKMHFDIATVLPAILGSFVIAVTVMLFKEWLNQGKKDSLMITMVGGIVISFIFITLTWIAADYVLVFTGVHRYLTVPAIGSSIFIAGLITIIFKKIHSYGSTRLMAYLIFLALIPWTIFNATVIRDYFNYELTYAGTDAAGHIRMKTKLWSLLPNFSKTEPSIFYFDESKDHDNGYFDETTIMAGFNYWMRFRGSDVVPFDLTPALLRSNLICHEERNMCLDAVKALVTEKDGEKGILYGGIFYKAKNFYAFRFINKDIVDIRSEIVKAIGLN